MPWLKGERQAAVHVRASRTSATSDVRKAIAAFAESNVGKLQTWLDAIAEKDPARAADLFVRVLEYHVPKLARTELSGKDGSPLNFTLFVPPKTVRRICARRARCFSGTQSGRMGVAGRCSIRGSDRGGGSPIPQVAPNSVVCPLRIGLFQDQLTN